MNLWIWKDHGLRRAAAVLMTGAMAVSLLPAAALAAPSSSPSREMARAIASAQVRENPFDFENDSDTQKLDEAAGSFPERFDLRHCDTDGDGVYENYVTPVKLQNPFGTCWGFGAVAAAEISLLGSGLARADGYGPVADPANGVKELDLSEKHLAYFASTPLNDRNASQDGEGLVYDRSATAADRFNACGDTVPKEIIAALSDNRVTKWAYNASFERVCLAVWLRRNYPQHFHGVSTPGYNALID